MKKLTADEIKKFRENVNKGSLDKEEDEIQKKLDKLFEKNRYVVIARYKENTNVYSIADTRKCIRAVVKEVNLELKDKYKTEKDIREIKALDRVYENPRTSVKDKHGLDHIIELIEYKTDELNPANLPTKLYQITVEADCTLDDYFKKNKSTDEITEQFIGLCTGLEQLHEQIIHRDIKPKNILMEDGKAKFCDMGNACGRGGNTTEGPPGTRDYMAPDFILSTKSDIFSLGATLYEIVTGVQASKKIYQTGFAQKKEKECNRKIEPLQLQQLNQAGIDHYDDDELSENHAKIKKIVFDGRKEVIKDYLDKMQEQCGNEYLKEIIKKAMNPEADINLIDPETNVRYQTAREMKTDLIIAQNADRLRALVERFSSKKLTSEITAVAEKVNKRETKYETSNIEEAYKAKWQFCNELLQDAEQKYGITREDLAKSHLLRLYTDNKVMSIFQRSLDYFFEKKPNGLGIKKLTELPESVKTMEMADNEKRKHYAKEKAAHINPLDAETKMQLLNWEARLLDLKRKCGISMQV